jgi:hypothetical protein
MRISKRSLIAVLSATATVVAIGALVWYSTYRSTRDLEIQAVRATVAWVFEDQPMPNYEEVVYGVPGTVELRDAKYKARRAMRAADRWYVICDFLPEGVSLSDNPRIERISEEEGAAIFDQAIDDREGSFLLIVLSRDESGRVIASQKRVGLVMFATYAPLGADMYELIFTRVDGQLNVTGTWTGGS